MLIRPEFTEEVLSGIIREADEASGFQFSSIMEESESSGEATAKIFLLEYTTIAILGTLLHNVVDQKRGSRAEYLKFISDEISAAAERLKKNPDALYKTVGGVEASPEMVLRAKALFDDKDMN